MRSAAGAAWSIARDACIIVLTGAGACAWGQESAKQGEDPRTGASGLQLGDPVETELEAGADLTLSPAEDDPTWAWSVEIKPMVWVPGLRGDFELPGSSEVDVETINIDEVEAAPAGRVSIRAGDWTIRFRGFAFDLEERAPASRGFTLGGGTVARGDAVETDLEFSGFDLTAGYRVATPIEDSARETRLGFDVFGGVRVSSLSMEVASGASFSAEDGVWAQPIVGGRVTMDLPRRFAVEAGIDLGAQPFGDDSGLSFDITAAFQWRFAGNHGGLEIGFRHHQVFLESDGFEFNTSLAGLYGAVVFRF